MDARRLRAVVDAVWNDYQGTGVPTLLNNLESRYAQSVQSPNTTTADAFSSAMAALMTLATEGACSKLSQHSQQILARIGGAEMCGAGLANSVKSAIENADSPAITVQLLQELRARATTYGESIEKLHTSMSALGIDAAEPPVDAAEVELSLPTPLFSGSLGGLAKVTKQLDGALSDIVEAATGSRPPLQIRGADSGSVDLYVAVDLEGGAAILNVITAILSLIGSIVGYRIIKLQLRGDQAPKDVLEGLDKWDRERVEMKLAELRSELLSHRSKTDGRTHELDTALSLSLPFLANQLDHGLSVEVTTALPHGEPELAAESDDLAPKDPANKTKQARTEILQSMARPRLLKSPSDPVLRLGPPEPPAEEESPPKSPRGKKQ